MHRFRKILYVTLGNDLQGPALAQALMTASKNDAPLGLLACFPEFPGSLGDYRDSFRHAMLEELQREVTKTSAALELDFEVDAVRYEIEFGKTPGLRIVRTVLQDDYQLVIKNAEPREGAKGFQAIDMELLRKCPSALWLCRQDSSSLKNPKIAVAVNPEIHTTAGGALALRLLELSASLSHRLDGELDLISCWFDPFEESLRRSAWYHVPDHALEKVAVKTRKHHREALDDLISRAGIHEKFRIHQLHGEPDEEIPRFVEQNGIDILIMGTVARTGIPGFLIGNTAENVLQKISCSLLALKPKGFECPISIVP